MNITSYITTTLLALAIASCADSSFTGSNASKKKPATQGTDPSNPTTYPNGTNSNPGTNITNNPNTNTNNNTDLGSGGGLSLEWGSLGQSWHVGNNDFGDTGCKARVAINLIDSWDSANFYFKVLQNNTSVQINVLHCGVDAEFTPNGSAPTKDTATLLDFNNQMVGTSMILNQSNNLILLSNQPFPNRVNLNVGTYKVRVKAGARSDGEVDDFVTRVKISADKPIEKDPEPKEN